jgi:hypothetical protein
MQLRTPNSYTVEEESDHALAARFYRAARGVGRKPGHNSCTCKKDTSVEVRNVGGVCRSLNECVIFIPKLRAVTSRPENGVILRVWLVRVDHHRTGIAIAASNHLGCH